MERVAGKYLGVLKHLTVVAAMGRVTGGAGTDVDRPGKGLLQSSRRRGGCGAGQRGWLAEPGDGWNLEWESGWEAWGDMMDPARLPAGTHLEYSTLG